MSGFVYLWLLTRHPEIDDDTAADLATQIIARLNPEPVTANLYQLVPRIYDEITRRTT